MPKLTKVRLVSVGAPAARMDDLLLDFTDAESRPVDATIWLRNAGGKSSILNLFFSILRPNRREFLGSTHGDRDFEDYFQPDDHSVLAAEWELDRPGRDMFEGAPRYVTGVFCEWRDGRTSDPSNLKRHFFASRIQPDVEELTLEGLPIYTTDEDGHRVRRRLSGFRRAWRELAERHPHAQVVDTRIQSEWEETLDATGIDPKLFSYQITMNRREGGADDLFRFGDTDAFVDFFLELVLDPGLGERVSKNIAQYRDDLRYRLRKLLPERELVTGLQKRIEPVLAIADQRLKLSGHLADLRGRLIGLEQYTTTRIRELKNESSAAEERARSKEAEAEAARREARDHSRRAALLRRAHVRRELDRLADENNEVGQRLEAANRARAAWTAALPLREARRAEQKARVHEEELARERNEHSDLLEEVRQVSHRYAGALLARTKRLRQEADEAGGRAAEHRQAARAVRYTAQERTAGIARYQERIENLEAKRTRVEEALEDLVGDGLLEAGETPTDGRERVRETMDAAQEELRRLEGRVQEIVEDRRDVAAQMEAARDDRADVEQQLARVADALERVTEARVALESSPALARYLEVAQLDLTSVSDEAPRRVEEVARGYLRRLVQLKIDRAADERALRGLDETGLLPPQRDVERVLEVLRDRAAAWCGWHYLAENRSAEATRRYVSRRPEIAAGVIVRDEDFDAATKLLEEADLVLEGPVAVAGQTLAEAAEGDETVQPIVFGPTGNAHFDREAGREEAERRRIDVDQVDFQIRQLDEQHREAADLARRLRAYLDAYPPSWYEERHRERDRDRQRREALLRREEGLRDRDEKLLGERQRLQDEQARLRDRMGNLDRDRTRLEAHLDHFPTPPIIYTRRIREHEAAVETLEEEKQAAEVQASSEEERAEEAARERERLREDLRTAEDRLGSVRYRGTAEVEPEPGDVEALERRYRARRDAYEEKVDEKALLRLKEDAEREAARHRSKFLSLAEKERVTEAEVAHTLDELEDPELIEQRQDDADGLVQRTRLALANIANRRRPLEAELAELEARCDELEVAHAEPPADAPEDTEALLKEIEQLGALVPEFQEMANTLTGEAEQAWERVRDLDRQRLILEKDLRRLEDVHRSHADLLDRAGQAEETGQPRELEDEALEAAISDLQATLMEAREKHEALAERRDRAVHGVRAWLDDERFAELKSETTRQFRDWRPAEFEEEAGRLAELLEVRAKTIKEKLAEKEKHREILIDSLLGAAEDGVRMLKAASRQSTLPDTLSRLAGAPFLKIYTGEPSDGGERRGRMAELLNDLAEQDEVPAGLAVVQQAVRRLARPIRVKMLKPEPHVEPQYFPIVEFGTFSGGERITAAVMLYSTLARLRARQRGRHRYSSGVLILDNPIGSASRPKFLEMQQAVAAAMNIQLVYATGVNDYEAVRMFPKLLRLRNDLRDRKTGDRLVQLADEESTIEAVHFGQKVRPTVDRAGHDGKRHQTARETSAEVQDWGAQDARAAP